MFDDPDYTISGEPVELTLTADATKDYLADRLFGEYVESVNLCAVASEDSEPRLSLRFSSGVQLIIGEFMLFEPQEVP